MIAAGLLLAGRQRDAADYFLGRRGLPWWAIMLSIVATETSALTVISVPGLAARGDLTFLQLSFGYLVGRLGVAALLLPGYFDGTQETAYQRLERRFGPLARRVASGAFLVTRALGDGVRVFATAIPLAIITSWSIPVGILAVGIVTIFYTWVGGLRAVVWVDVVQLVFYLLGGIATIVIALQLADDGFPQAWAAGKLAAIDPSFSFKTTYTLWGGLIGGALLSAASHGTDHLIVQRLLAARDLPDAKKALIGSGLFVIVQFALFLLVGTSLWLAGADRPGMVADAIYPTFVVERLPAGLAGLVVAAILAAAMSTVASSLNSLASASTHDFYAALTGRTDAEHLLKVGRGMTLLWAAILVGGAMLFRDRNTPVVVLALSIASITYGGLLGSYLLGGLWPRARQVDVIIAIVTGVAVMIPVVLGFPVRLLDGLAWPWYVPLGTGVTVAVGMLSSLIGRADGRTGGRDAVNSPPDSPSARPPVFLGIDAGGSHTAVVVGDGQLTVLGRAEGPGSAMRPGGAAASAAVIADTARRAATQAGVALPADAAMVGAAGAGREPEQRELAAALVAAEVARTVRVAGDTEVALTAAFSEGPGMVLNAGTGSIAFARTPDGQLHRAGGYGWQLGDEGGGYWLGRRALAAAARSHDTPDESSTLLERLLVALGLRTFDDLIRWTAMASAAQVAALAPHVLGAARDGEAVAQVAVSEAATELARLVGALAPHFPGTARVPVAVAGGLLRPGSPLVAALRAALAADVPRARLVDGPVDAPVGALALAARLPERA